MLASSADEPEFTALRAALDAEDVVDAATFSGGVSHDELTSAGAAAVYRDPRDLPSDLETSLPGKGARG